MIDVSAYSPAVQLLALTRFGGLTPRLFVLLFQRFGTLEGILLASEEELGAITGITGAVARKLSKAPDHLAKAAKLAAEWQQREIRISTHFDHDYAQHLDELNDPPPLLFVRGRMPSPDKKAVTLIGTHAATPEGIDLTTRLAKAFAKAGVQVVSSLAGGNDAAAHLGARSAGGTSFAVINTGFDHIAHTEEIPLAIDIALQGGIISEYPPEFDASDSTLEATDRLLVGLGQAVVVTEVYQHSRRTHDILEFCGQIGKLAFLMIDPKYGLLADKESLAHALKCGAIPLEGLEHTQDIVISLV